MSANLLPDQLKPRELEVLRLMAGGLSNREIGEHLYIGIETVRWYAKQIYSKLEVSGREEAAEKAQQLGLLDEDPGDLESHDALPNNLPKQTTAFIGRETELNDLQALILDDKKRLVTVLAPGGMGKTRLALEVGANLVGEGLRSSPTQADFKDGIFFVPLQPLSNPENIIHAVAHHAGYQFQNDGREPKQQVLDFLAVKNALLVIDNWEHLLEGAPLVGEIMQAAPEVKILATSREKLNLSGETIYNLQGLHYPKWETPQDALEYDAVKLLVQAARRVKPDWEITQDNLDYVARTCRLTAGMPLAIILASAWLDMLTLEEITVEIQKNVDFLETEMRDVPDRQRSIRAVFDYTWNRLEPTQRDIFMKLSVFRGGFTRHAAENVTQANLRLLHRLSDKALISRDPDGRFEIHELLRQYGEAELDSSPLANDIYAAHSEYYLTWLAELEPQIKGHGQLEALDEVEAEFENISRAWNYALQAGVFERVRDASEALCWGLSFRDRELEGRMLFEAAQKAVASKSELELIWAQLTVRHQFLGIRGWATSEKTDPAIEIAERQDDRTSIALGLIVRADNLYRGKHYEQAVAASQRAYEIAEARDDRFYMGYSLGRIGLYIWVTGDNEGFADYTERAITIQREIGDEANLISSLSNSGVLFALLMQYELALDRLQEARQLARRMEIYGTLVYCLIYLAAIYYEYGQAEQTRHLIQEADAIANNLQKPHNLGVVLAGYSWLAILDGEFASAELAAKRALAMLRTLHPLWVKTTSLTLAFSLLAQGRAAEAAEYLSINNVYSDIWREAKEFCALKALYWAQTNQPIKATMMLAFTYSDTINAYHWYKEMPLFQNTYNQLQSELSESEFQAAWERGQSMSMEAALTFALEEDGD